MRAIRFEGAGQAGVIKLLEEPLPQLRPHDLLARVRICQYAEGVRDLSPGWSPAAAGRNPGS